MGPYRVFALEGVRIVAVAVMDAFTVAVTEAGAVYWFGFNDRESVFLPERIEALDGIHVATVAAGDFHVLALTRCGRVYSWGRDGEDSPELGRGNDTGGGGNDRSIPQVITALLGERVRGITAGPFISCAVTDAGALYTWGRNRSGSLGHGDELNWDRPTLVQGLHGIRVVGVSCFKHHALTLAADGSVYLFGQDPGLGIRQEGEQSTRSPQRIPNLVCMVPR
jgi:E3 ubiquitin-protein ligase HERC2